MKVLLVLVAGLAVAQQGNTPPPATQCRCPGINGSHVLLSNLLQVAGYNDTCVTAALDSCSSRKADGHLEALVEDTREMMQQVSLTVNKWESRPRHCKDMLDSGDTGSGLRQVYPYPGQPYRRVTVYCNQKVDGGGWTILQRRSSTDIRQDFYRTFVEYQLGFGDLKGEFWLGLDLLHELTTMTLQELRVDLGDYEGEHRFAKYGLFHVGTPTDGYLLSVGRYSGNAGDSLTEFHHGSRFSAHDKDNDKTEEDCALTYRGAWWYNTRTRNKSKSQLRNTCHRSNLNGYQHEGKHSSFADGINWFAWRGHYYSMKHSSMMIRPAF